MLSLLESLKIVGAFVTFFKLSVLGSDKLKHIQTQMGCKQLKVVHDVKTRRNSSLLMIKRLMDLKESLSAALVSIQNAPTMLTSEQRDNIAECVNLLEPFFQMTEKLSGEKYPTISMVIPIVRGLFAAVYEVKANTVVGQELRNNLISGIQTRLGQVEKNKIIAYSTLLDPRFKKAGFGNMSNAREAEDGLKEELALLCRNETNFKRNKDHTNQELERVEFQNAQAEDKAKSKVNLWSVLQKNLSEVKNTTNPTCFSTLMLRQYFETPHEDLNSCPGKYWIENKNSFKQLSQLALKYLCIPATSVPSERIFSTAGQIVSERRSRLKPKNVNMILFLNENL